jgi:superfamily I DNA/RNA helicase
VPAVAEGAPISPRYLVNATGESFEAEIATVEPLLAALPNAQRLAYRNGNAETIAQHDSGRLLIVAGPGSGKSYLFLSRIRHWLANHSSGSIYVTSFVRKLVRDLQAEIQSGFAEEDRNRLSVTTLHGLARSIVERSHGTEAHRLEPNAKVISPLWSGVVWQDVCAFHTQRHALASLERQFYTERFEMTDAWPEILGTYLQICRFYNAVGFAHMIVLARLAVHRDPSLISDQLWIVDEFQDFNAAEEHLIRQVSVDALGVLIAGDDEQALYQQLKASHPEIIISYYDDAAFANAMLPYCSRCSYHVCLAASGFIAQHREPGAIKKIYLPLQVQEQDPRVRVVAAAGPGAAVDYIRRFVEEHRNELEAHRAEMESGQETDPFLLILTPERTVCFYRTGGAQDELLTLVDEWSHVELGHGADYWGVMAHCAVDADARDNFALRKILDAAGLSVEAVHPLLAQALDRGCRLCEVASPDIASAIERSHAIAAIARDTAVPAHDRAQAIDDLVGVEDLVRLATDLATSPIDPLGNIASDESEEAIETAGAMAPIELLTLVGAKGLSARHVIVLGCDDVNMLRTSALTFFVALTRARSSLHLLMAAKAGGASAIHPFVLELPDAHCEYFVHKKSGGVDEPLTKNALVRRVAQWATFARRAK